MLVKFRTETAYGNAGHTPAEILAYETFSEELCNEWIPEEMQMQISCCETEECNYQSVINKLKKMSLMIKNDEADEYFKDYTLAVPFFQEIIDEIGKIAGKRVEYLLWLGEFDAVIDKNLYGHNIENPIDDIDAYDVDQSLCMLVEVMCDGNLYAFSEKPKMLSKEYVKEAYSKFLSKGEK